MATFTTVMTVIGLLYAASVIALTAIAYFAPSGWEDEAGFHYGIKPENDDSIHVGSTKLAPRVAGGDVGQGRPSQTLEEAGQHSQRASRAPCDATLREPVDAVIAISKRPAGRSRTLAAVEQSSAAQL